jgi:2-oxoisovalerate dehydrogenase E2 component (dihydrolipoyl transacylase)
MQERNDEEAVPVTGVRRRIAQRMQDAMRRIPHFTYVEEVDVTELELLRARINERWGAERAHLTLLPLLVRAVALACRASRRSMPDSTTKRGCSRARRGARRHRDPDRGRPHGAGAAPRGSTGSRSSATEIARLADAARAGRATRDELSGSTITLTSLGALGGIASTPIINCARVAIVGVNRIVLRPVMLGGAVVARRMMNLSSSFDHRVVDGQLRPNSCRPLRGFARVPGPAVRRVARAGTRYDSGRAAA